jgi:hypothetical protein
MASVQMVSRRLYYHFRMNIFFDILDTLLNEQGDPRPHAHEVPL